MIYGKLKFPLGAPVLVWGHNSNDLEPTTSCLYCSFTINGIVVLEKKIVKHFYLYMLMLHMVYDIC